MMTALRHRLGIDGAVGYTFLARVTSIAGSTGTVLLIVHFLSPVEQGYYYTLLSLVALQLVFELGFSFVIQQLAAHECVHLELRADGSVSGDPVAHARLASALRLCVLWYSVASAAMILILAPLGMIFFAHHTSARSASVAWHGPWLLAVIAAGLSLWCMPLYSFLDGCGHVREVAALRFRQAVATAACSWIPLLFHHGLYSPALAIAGYTAAGLHYICTHRRFLIGLWRYPSAANAVHWVREVWPFQWRIAVSSTCSYFTVQVLIPILFAFRGPIEAGQMGMSISIASYITVLALGWTSTKTTPFGNLIARGQFQRLDDLFQRALRQSMAVFALMAVVVCAGASALPFISLRLAGRMVSPRLFALLVLAAGAQCIVQSLGILLRSFKTEPFLAQSLAVALLTLAVTAITVSRWGDAGATFSYFLANAAIGLPFALVIFVHARKGYLGLIPCAAGRGSAG